MRVFPPATAIERSEYLGLHRKFKDHPEHVPEELRQLEKKVIEIAAGGYALRQGEEMDTEDWQMMLTLVKQGNMSRAVAPNLPALGRILLQGMKNKALSKLDSKEETLAMLYQHFRTSRERQMPEDLVGYTNLMAYKEFVGDTLRGLIGEALEAYKSQDPDGYSEAVREIAAGRTKDLGGIARKVSGIIDAYRKNELTESNAKEVVEKVLSPLGISGYEMWPHLLGKEKQEIVQIFSGQTVLKESPKEELVMHMAQALLGREYAGMWRQMQKWEYREGTERMRLKPVVSKRKAHAAIGLNMGVCTAADEKLWDDPNFLHLILFDEAGVAQGGAHLLVVEEGGKKYLSLPGINPSIALMNKAQAEEIYDTIITLAQDIAELMGCEKELLIPTKAFIHSNRLDIQQIVASRSRDYENKPLSRKIQFSYQPNYSFRRVFVVPAKVKPEVIPVVPEQESVEIAL